MGEWKLIYGPDDVDDERWEEDGVVFLRLMRGFSWAIYLDNKLAATGNSHSEEGALAAARVKLAELREG